MSTWSLSQVLAGLHDNIHQRLETARKTFGHPGTKGDATESVWLELLNSYLPKRYEAAKAHVVDSLGCFSDQIDVVVFDRQYSPFIFKFEGATIVPAESVYAVFEVKPEINKEYIEYAAAKVQSVRALKRTNSDVYHAGGKYEAKKEQDRFTILGGILGTRSWTNFDEKIKEHIGPLTGPQEINIGCSLQRGSFTKIDGNLKIGSGDFALMSFFTQLHEALRKMATAWPMDINQYYPFK